jgi:hypothetical protein
MTIELVGVGSFTQSTGAPTIGLPSGVAQGHLLVLAVHSANQAVNAPSGYIEVSASPQGTGTAGSSGSVRLSVFYKIATAFETSVTLNDSGDVTGGLIYAFRGIDTLTPIDTSVGSIQASATTNWLAPAITVSGDNKRILWLIANDRDANNTSNTTATHPTLGITELSDQTTNTATGGGISSYFSNTGVSSSTVDPLNITSATSNRAAFITLAINTFVPPTEFAASATILSNSTGIIDTSILLSSSSNLVLNTQGQLVTPFINLEGQATISTSVSDILRSYSEFNSISTISTTSNSSLTNSIILLSIPCNLTNNVSATVATNIQLAATSSIRNTSSSIISTSIALNTFANIQVLSNTPILGSISGFSAISTLTTGSDVSLLTNIRLNTLANVFNTSSIPILGNELSLQANVAISFKSNSPKLGNLISFDGTGLISTSIFSADLRIGVNLSVTASVLTRVFALLTPDWTNSNIKFFTNSKNILFSSSKLNNKYKSSYIYNMYESPHTFKYVTPIDRLREL